MGKRSWGAFYTLDGNPIGRGGQAEVFRAVDRKTGTVVALKRLAPITEDALARMKREVEVQKQLNHPRIMPIIRHSDRYSWYTMPLARLSLRDLVPPVPDEQILEVALACVEALVAAHGRRFVHRDITPTNILDIGAERPHWVISDWGLVRRHELATRTRTQPGEFGTAGFAAPETWHDAHSADERADIYSLGRVVAWAVTGTTLIPNVPLVPEGRFGPLVRAATAMRPEDRPESAMLLLERLLAAASSPPPRDGAQPEGIPPEVISSIRARAQEQFPDDYSTQKYVIDRETNAWYELQSLVIHDLPADVLVTITSQAARQFPSDFSTRLYVIKRETEAWRELQDLQLEVPTQVFERIVAKARREFPHDYSTQLYVIQREAESWRELNG